MSPYPVRRAALILAAGAARRFGSTKQLATAGGKTLVQTVIDRLAPLFPGQVHAVLGANADDIEQSVNGIQLIRNPDWRGGMGTSIAAGVRALTDAHKLDAILIALADQPAIPTAAYAELLDQSEPDEIRCAAYLGRWGAPALFPARSFDMLMQLTGDQGARRFLQPDNQPITAIDIPEAALDVDTPADLGRLPNA